MYAIYGNIYHQYTPNVSIYTIYGSYGSWNTSWNCNRILEARLLAPGQPRCPTFWLGNVGTTTARCAQLKFSFHVLLWDFGHKKRSRSHCDVQWFSCQRARDLLLKSKQLCWFGACCLMEIPSSWIMILLAINCITEFIVQPSTMIIYDNLWTIIMIIIYNYYHDSWWLYSCYYP